VQRIVAQRLPRAVHGGQRLALGTEADDERQSEVSERSVVVVGKRRRQARLCLGAEKMRAG
jgi:hypothetical protein